MYTPTNWQTGDTITASAMNKLENGVANAGSVLICNAYYSDSADDYVLDKTVQEIYEALSSGTPAYIKMQYGVLGTDYVYQLFLAPIVKIYTYNVTDVIKIVANRPIQIGTKGNYSFCHTPATLTFYARSLTDYPQRDANIMVSGNYVEANDNII